MRPKEYKVDGKVYELYTIGELCERLHREAQTIRKWERKGTIPEAQFRSKANRRLYTEEQINAIVETVRDYELRQGSPIPDEFVETVFRRFSDVSE